MTTKERTREIVEFACTMAQECNGKLIPLCDMIDACTALMRLSKRHHRLSEKDCNEGLKPAEVQANESLEQEIGKLAKQLDATAIFGGDPRGCTVKLKVPSGRTNDFGQEGICVPQ